MSDLTRFKGGAELQAFLDQLPAKMEANVMRAALRAGAKVILDEAKNNVPIDSGLLRDSLRVSTRIRRGVVTATVTTGSKATKKVVSQTKNGKTKVLYGNPYYAHFVEFGTAAHFVKSEKKMAWSLVPNKRASSGYALRNVITKEVGKMHPGTQAKPFMRPALDGKAGEALHAVGEAIRKRLNKQGINAPDGLEIETDE